MSLVDVDTWLTEYESCERLVQNIRQHLSQRDKRQRLSAEYNRLTNSIQVGLKQLTSETQQLKQKLDDSAKERSITFEEIERRQRQVETLQSLSQQLQRQFTSATRADSASTLMEPASSAWNSNNIPAEPRPIPTDIESLKRHQIEALEEQNRGLDVLSQTISRQRALASQFGNEVNDQNDILDNLANTMDRVDTRVNAETGHIGQISRQDNTWGYWITILILFIAIVIVSIVL